MRLVLVVLLAFGCAAASAQESQKKEGKKSQKHPSSAPHQQRGQEPAPGSPAPKANAPDRQRTPVSTKAGDPSPAQRAQQKQLEYQQQNQPNRNPFERR